MAPLAGKPPFATDEPDSFYETPRAPAQRRRQPGPEDPNKRTSAYDVYDNYLEGQDKTKLGAAAPAQGSRNSGIGAMLMNMDMDDDSDDEEEDVPSKPSPTKPPGISTPSPPQSPSKNAAATQQQQQHQQRGPPPPQMSQGPPQQHPPQMREMRGGPMVSHQQQMPPPQPIAAPRPGYPAPIAALNLARPEPAAAGPGPMGGRQQPPMLQINPNMPMPPRQNGGPVQNPFEPQNPFASPGSSHGHGRPSPSPSPSLHSSTPHPLQPPVTPITPAFIRPAKSSIPPPIAIKFDESSGAKGPSVAFKVGSDPIPRKGIMRGDDETTLLPTRGEKGDDFWRRFSMVVKEEQRKPGGKQESSWLRKTQSGYSSYSRSVWIVGMTLLLLVVGGVAAGIYFTRNNSPNSQPTAIGGSADQAATYSSSATVAVASAKAKAGAPTSSSLHVSPTNTVARRDGEEGAVPTPVVGFGGGHSGHFGVVKMHAHKHPKSRLL